MSLRALPLVFVGCASGSSTASVDATPQPDPVPRCSAQSSFGTPVLVGGINTASSDPYAWLSPDELTIYVTSDRPGSDNYDFYTASRNAIGDSFGSPTRMANINTIEGDL